MALAAGVPAFAQNLITLSPDNPVEVAIPDKDFTTKVKTRTVKAEIRPNSPTAGVYFVYAKNTHATQDRTLVVELRGVKGEFIAEGKAEKVPADNWKLVRFTKPAAPPTPPAPAPALAANAPAAAPVEPPPPGVSVARGTDGFKLNFKLYEIDDAKGIKAEVSGGERLVEVSFKNPTTYVKVGDLTGGNNNTATIDMTPIEDGVSTVKITFPGQPNGAPPPGVTGLFAATLDKSADSGQAVKLGGMFPSGVVPQMNVAIDGVERVSVFKEAKSADLKGVVPADKNAAVRVLSMTGAKDIQPSGAFAVRVETDNAASDDTLELHVKPVGSPGTVEILPLGGARNEKLWVDVAESTKQGLGFATRATDWVKPLDLLTARGEVLVEAVLKAKGSATSKASGTLSVVVDAEPPTVGGSVVVGNPDKPKERVVKGDILPVRATVTDTASGVKKVTFVMYSKLQDDGTFPPDAIKADAVQQKEIDAKTGKPTDKLSNEWVAELVPPEKAGRFKIAAIAHDHAGNASKVEKDERGVKVVLVDLAGATARGAISGIILFGGRPQPGLSVAVGGPDGKAKAVTQTNAQGKFCIDDMLPGSYTVVTMKTDANKGFSGQADVTVEPEKTAKVTIELVRNKDGR